MEAEHDLMLVREVAELLRTSKMGVYRLIHNGELATVRVGRSYRVRRTSFQAFLDQDGSK